MRVHVLLAPALFSLHFELHRRACAHCVPAQADHGTRAAAAAALQLVPAAGLHEPEAAAVHRRRTSTCPSTSEPLLGQFIAPCELTPHGRPSRTFGREPGPCGGAVLQ